LVLVLRGFDWFQFYARLNGIEGGEGGGENEGVKGWDG